MEFTVDKNLNNLLRIFGMILLEHTKNSLNPILESNLMSVILQTWYWVVADHGVK